MLGTIEYKKDFIQGKNTIYFIPKDKVPQCSKITYANLICDLHPLKLETHRVCMNIGGDQLTYEGDPSLPTIFLLNTKIMLNKVLLDVYKGAGFMT